MRSPCRGTFVSSWYADGELIEPIGSMSRLPDEIFDAGIAQDCWALWDAEQRVLGLVGRARPGFERTRAAAAADAPAAAPRPLTLPWAPRRPRWPNARRRNG